MFRKKALLGEFDEKFCYPKSLHDDLTDIIGKYPSSILLRHAERFEIASGAGGSDVALI